MAPTVPIEFAGQKESRKYSLSQAMGKSRKYSKGLSFGFVPDYRHAVETVGESEGFGSSGRMDTGISTLDDSRAIKRKRISMNADGYDCFGAPLQVFSLSTLSRSERKDLELRLKLELEQVRLLQKRASNISSIFAVSSSSNIQSSSDQHRGAPPETLNRLNEVSVPPAKKPVPSGRNAPSAKRSSSGRFESAKPAAVSASSTASLKQCEQLLQRLMSHTFGWVFNTPVDVVKLNIPDYFTVIKHPMDLGTVKSKLTAGEYAHPLDFAADVRLTFSNAMTYNPPANDVHTMAKTLSKFFEVRWKTIEKKFPMTTEEQRQVPSATTVPKEAESALPVPPPKKTKFPTNDPDVQPNSVVKVMTDQEKHKLSVELEALLGELPESIIDFLKAHSSNPQAGEDEIEIDIDALSDDTLFALRRLLDDYMTEKQKCTKAEPCVVELHNESGFSNSSMPPSKGRNDPIDEDVDILGGNDPPVSSYPPIEIEKDAVRRDSKCSNSSSSSSESGSSSSDSGSESLSGSESNAAKALDSNVAPKEILCSETNVDQKQCELGDLEIGNYEENEIGLVDHTTEANTNTIEPDSYQEEGESAPSKRQVSPDRLYRAALLRNRFADTILKAREKALEKGDKRDPEKVRMEREELERQQREEKARLQAEAKAAEDARRKAEAEAAAEAKKKRELDREAARQALLKMEKTVDINENSQFMEDLEMLRASNDELLPNFTEESSPEHSQNGFGSFKLQGSNPLEQLGLYMKVDEEDEEEESEPPQSVNKAANDVEEGEID
ncbi:transcription factor GTE10 isoform X2 [Cucumis melo var. makuwa]|uniref:Transcription factor GTE10 isoform X2 n=1 Tax=Cucumis melo var. makuwa TaxID=1194695 RepID=A0A5A7URM4_CUCMM|nr:transcription factor GTE10 isoform X2 [Cucumis melo var. makuwa]